MSAALIRGVIRRLGSSEPVADADLVAAFASGRNADAFAELVNRHGPTVLGVCQRVLGNTHDAEDAFQAVFLVLARRVKMIRPAGSVGGWLYGVAVRTANKARVALARRRRREMIAATNSASREPQRPEEAQVELRADLDEEIGKLPEPLRAVVVLCDLNEKTRAEAARELGCPEGTVAARLHRARKRLAEALGRRGLALPAAGLATTLLPAALPAAAGRAAVVAALERASPAVLALAREVSRSMASTTHMMAMGAITLLAGGLLAAGNLWPSDSPAGPLRTPPSLEVPIDQPITASTAVRKESKVLELEGLLAGSVAYSVDGKVLFVGATNGTGLVRAYTADTHKLLWESKGSARLCALSLSQDGKTLAVTARDGVQFLDAATGKPGDRLEEPGVEPLAVGYFPPTIAAPGVAAHKVIFGNARGYVVKSWLKWPEVGTTRTGTVPAGREPVDAFAVPLAVSPDGKRVVVTGPIDRESGKNILWAWSAGSGEANKFLAGHRAVVTCAAWSKDGKTILTGDAEGIVIAWDGETFKEKSRSRFGPRIAAVAVSPDGKTLAAAVAALMPAPNKTEAYTEMVFVWQPTDPLKGEPRGKIIRRLPNGIVEIDLGSRDTVTPGQAFTVLPSDFPEKGRQSRLKQYRVPDDKGRYKDEKRFVPKGTVEVTEVLGPNLSRARITMEADSIRDGVTRGDLIYDVEDTSPKNVKPLFHHDASGPFQGVASLAFAPDGKSLAVAFANFTHLARLGELVGKVRVFTIAGEERKDKPGLVSDVGFSLDGKRFFVLKDGRANVFDADTGQELYSALAEAARFTADGKWLVAMGPREVAFHEIERGPITNSHHRAKTKWGWHRVAFAPDGKRYAAHFGHFAGVFDVATGFEPVRLEEQHEPGGGSLVGVTGKDIVFSPDGKKVAAVGVLVKPGTVGAAVWDTETGKRLLVFEPVLAEGPQSIGFSPTSAEIAIGWRDRVEVWALTGEVKKNPVRKFNAAAPVTALSYSSDGRLLAAGVRKPVHRDILGSDVPPDGRRVSYRSEVLILDAQSAQERQRLWGFEGGAAITNLPVLTLAFSPNGKKLLAGTGILNMTEIPPDAPTASEAKTFELDVQAPPPRPERKP